MKRRKAKLDRQLESLDIEGALETVGMQAKDWCDLADYLVPDVAAIDPEKLAADIKVVIKDAESALF